MKKDNVSKKDETMIFAISVILMLYVNRIYWMASINDEDVMTFVKEEDAVDFALRVHMLDVLNEFDYYKILFGTGKEKKEYIDMAELLERVTFYYGLYIRDMLIRNLEKGQSLVDNGVLDWDLDINK
ncbi:hypothetical protein ABMQ79_002434 [Salmonella enterica]|uniref:hypothetical protein n=1 Tax=Klebsiella pneumoniae TaxID=573 RepID=UPI0012820E68|nr:hypothetical protein [Klebsiella pneumoniae]EAQ5799997.1 hypothetical protein [Salmonella enterica]EAW3954996.1 hypothetical protein [Salmonella enterica subsp. enterica]EBM9475741.1 hypothetical protein [Salmonella enterica subsp. enterica serovar Rubislaw]ECT6466658.1 hypothetical protein [Salmonella enterica subsp. enterica serovar Senegal]EDC0984105.1 hypothetical protein [Salmonella enterica subsp. enterica serovar Give]EEK0867329.1 hypothetical protein [Salmonella enterica subsp. ent